MTPLNYFLLAFKIKARTDGEDLVKERTIKIISAGKRVLNRILRSMNN